MMYPKINNRLCKGCEICIDICPKRVLGKNKDEIVVVSAENCTGCRLCEDLCPDFAIEVVADERVDSRQ